MVEQSGNKVPKRCVINDITLWNETGRALVQGSNLVGNNNILETWKDVGSEEPRKIVMVFSKSAAQRHEESLKPGQDIDLTA